MEDSSIFKYAVIGGGISGVTCSETLSALNPDDRIILISSSHLVKIVTNYRKLAHVLESFDVEEKPFSYVEADCANVKVLKSTVMSLDSDQHKIYTADNKSIQYEKLCICSGGRPKVIHSGANEYVIGIRDTESVKVFQTRLSDASRILVIGNGGIATELVYEIEGCQVIWAIKDKSIAATFVDAGAGEFFLPNLGQDKTATTGPVKRLKYNLQNGTLASGDEVLGGALGPDWASNRNMTGKIQGHNIHVEYKVEVEKIFNKKEFLESGLVSENPFSTDASQTASWPVYVRLSNGRIFGCDFVVSATGVEPNTSIFIKGNQFNLSEDGGITVNSNMQTSVADVYAAGDVCTAAWDYSEHWLQMRLWTQARQMGCYAAESMSASIRNEEVTLDFCFELFAHVTKFFNYKVVLLGKFNGQGLNSDYEILLRVTKGEEYIKVILKDGRMKGAVLIGETDMEETFENLILNKIDLTPFKENLLDSNIDIEDFFD